MIQDYALRPFRWVNIYSPKDIISGVLDFYDRPAPAQPQPGERVVENEEDPTADRPVQAHVQYWGGTLVFERLHEIVTCCEGAQPAPAAAPREASGFE